jgi:hypothetical protein
MTQHPRRQSSSYSPLWEPEISHRRPCLNTEWSKSQATHIKIFIDGCNSIQLDWVNKHTISLWLYKSPCRSRHVVTCSSQSVSCLSTVEVQGCLLSEVQLVFIVEHYLASRSYLTCQNKFTDTFPDSPVPNKSIISLLVKSIRDTGTLHRVASNMRKSVNACIAERGGHFYHLI